MKTLLVVTHKPFVRVAGIAYAAGGTPHEINVLSRAYRVTLLANLRDAAVVPEGYSGVSSEVDVIGIDTDYSGRVIRQTCQALNALFKTLRFCRRHHPDMVMGKAPNSVGMAGVIGASLARCTTVLRLGGDQFSDWSEMAMPSRLKRWVSERLRRFWTRWAVRRAHLVSSVSADILASLQRHVNVCFKAHDAFTDPCGDPDDYVSIPDMVFTVPRTILYVGRLSPEKDIPTLIRAFSRVQSAANDPLRLRIVGDGRERSRLAGLVDEMGLSASVEFAGNMPHQEVFTELAQSQLLVLPSRTEGLGKVLVEAAMAGRPVCASRVGGIPEVVQDGVTGLLFEPGCVDDLADKLTWLLTHEAEAREMGRAARSVAREWSDDAFLANIEALFEAAALVRRDP